MNNNNNNANNTANVNNPPPVVPTVAPTTTQHDPWTKWGVLLALAVPIIGFAGNVAYNMAKVDFGNESLKRIEGDVKENTDAIVQLKTNMATRNDIESVKTRMATKDDIDLIIKTINSKK